MSARLNVTIDDTSPMISYMPPEQWTQGSSVDAHGGSYTIANSSGASVSFTFEGNWVKVTGWKSHWHGNYTVTLDDSTYTFNGYTPSADPVRTTIFNNTVGEGSHSLTISNNDEADLQIDSISWSCSLGTDDDTDPSSPAVTTTTAEDTNGAFSYQPKGAWNVNPPPEGQNFRHGSGHSIHMLGASVNFTFAGTFRRDAVSIYGTTGPRTNSQYSVSRSDQDKQLPQQFTATRTMNSSNVLLYFANGFGPGNNTITMVNDGPEQFQIAYAEVHSAGAIAAATSPSSSTASTTTQTVTPTIITIRPTDPPSHSKLSGGVIAAIAIAALVFVFLIFFVWFLSRRNRTLWMRLKRGYMVQSQFDVGSPPNGTVMPLPYAEAPPPRPVKYMHLARNNSDESFEVGALSRAVTMQSTATTLVAQDGTNMTEVDGPRRFSLKALRLAARGTPVSSMNNLSSTAHLSRYPSTQHLLREESSQWYGGDHAEEREDRIDEVLRHPLRRNAPSQDHVRWQSRSSVSWIALVE